MKRLLIAAASAGLFAGGAAMAQPLTNTPSLLARPTANTGGATALPTPIRVTYPVPAVELGSAGHFTILTKTGITDVASSAVVGAVGTSPITGAADHLSCAEVTGNIYSVDAAGPAPCNNADPSGLTTAIQDMQIAYTDAAGRAPTKTNLGGGNLAGLTLAPGVYNWTTSVTIPADMALNGSSTGVWIFQIAQNLNLANATAVRLEGSAQSQHIFWQVAGSVTLGTSSHMEGVILSKTLISMKTGASITGRLLAQTAVTLQMNHVTVP